MDGVILDNASLLGPIDLELGGLSHEARITSGDPLCSNQWAPNQHHDHSKDFLEKMPAI